MKPALAQFAFAWIDPHWTRLPPRLLTCRFLPQADPRLCRSLGLPPASHHRSLALMTCDQDDSMYAALDHATKMAPVDVIYAKSFYAGSAHASGPLSGEIMGVLAADDPDMAHEGARAVKQALDDLFCFYQVAAGAPAFFPTVIPHVGEYLSAQAGIRQGEPLGYFIAPPVEAMVGVDAALKVADVELRQFFGPPTETNFAGCYLTGKLPAVEAAARAFAEAVGQVGAQPLEPPR